LSQLTIKGLKIQEILVANGKTIREEKWILPDIYSRPVNVVDGETVERFIESNDPRIRHYHWVQIYDWEDQMVVSYFLKCSRLGKSLFVDVSVFLLTQIADIYCGIDTLVPPDWRQRIRSGVGYLFLTPFTIIYSWMALLTRIMHEKFLKEERTSAKMLLSPNNQLQSKDVLWKQSAITSSVLKAFSIRKSSPILRVAG
jgi:hypothetical protein